MTTNPKAAAAPAFPSIGSNALTPSFSSIQRNRGNRFSVDLSSANVVDILLAYEAKQRKAKPNYSMQPVIKFIEDIEESERVAAKTEPYPGRWTLHIVVSRPEELDEELLSWIREAYDFANTK